MQVATQVVTMSSREIAELVGSRHTDVCRTVERLMASKVISGYAPMAYTHSQNGQTYTEYHICKRDSYIVVAQLCPEFTARLVDRWQELEAQVAAPSLPTLSRMDILKLAMESEERALAAEAKLIEQAPKADFYDKYTKAEGNKGIREVAKLLHANEREFVDFLISHDFMYRLQGRLTPHARHHHAHRFEVKAGLSSNDHAFSQAMFTPRGVTWIAAEWAKYQAVEHV